MDGYYILLLVSLGSCFGEWVLLPSIFRGANEIESRLSDISTQFSSENSTGKKFTNEFCPDFHNLTAMTFGSMFKERLQPRSGWEISLDDVEALLKESEKLPKKTEEKVNFIKKMEEAMMTEAETRITSLFAQSREARTKGFHFASMESALMTISLLLFGVYLSKLILRLLVSHYNRYNGGITMMTGIRAPIKLSRGRREKSMQLQKIQLMHLIDKYESRFN